MSQGIREFESHLFRQKRDIRSLTLLDALLLEHGVIYVMDRGYLDFKRLYLMHQARAFFVTRFKSNTKFRRVYLAPVDRSTGMICDQIMTLTLPLPAI